MSNQIETTANLLLDAVTGGKVRAVYKSDGEFDEVDDTLELVDDAGEELGASIQLVSHNLYGTNIYAGEYNEKFASRGDYFLRDVYLGHSLRDALSAALAALKAEPV